ncbi:Uncharacterised protein [Mycobacterium tuberculosis]|uniref:Uncharacterized protein n=2 Tax=Mycobacterium tuberculosis TaxID=1773 RepID=A0A655JMJ3_MYCTX|nr:Uncharacterised protein [Mycobacterium tuberculosis]SGO83097.1 Uncharacterised protein [Mycobacterium tuberculosis]
MIGTPARRAATCSSSVAAVGVCGLTSNAATSRPAIMSSTAAISAGVGSLPFSLAAMKVAGVRFFRPAAASR